MRTRLFVLLLVILFGAGCDCSETRVSRDEALRHTLEQMRQAIENFREDKQRYPADLDELIPNYIRKIPPDPITQTLDTWETIESPGGGIADIKSGAEETGCDGTRYDSW